MADEMTPSQPRRASYPLSNFSRRQVTGLISRPGDAEPLMPNASSEMIETRLHGSCRKCHHFHNKVRIRLLVHNRLFQAVKCERCSTPLFGIGGDSSHTSLVSQETRFSIQSNTSSALVFSCHGGNMPTIPSVAHSRSTSAERDDLLRVGQQLGEVAAPNQQMRLSRENLELHDRVSEEQRDAFPAPPPEGQIENRGKAQSSRQDQGQPGQLGGEPRRRHSRLITRLRGVRNFFTRVRSHLPPFRSAPPDARVTVPEMAPTPVTNAEPPTQPPNLTPAPDSPTQPPDNNSDTRMRYQHDPALPETSSARRRLIRRRKTWLAQRRHQCRCEHPCPCVHPSRFENMADSPAEPGSPLEVSAVPDPVPLFHRSRRHSSVVGHAGGWATESIRNPSISTTGHVDRGEVPNSEASFQSQDSTVYSSTRTSSSADSDRQEGLVFTLDRILQDFRPELSLDTHFSSGGQPAPNEEEIEEERTPTQTLGTGEDRTPTASAATVNGDQTMTDGSVDADSTPL